MLLKTIYHLDIGDEDGRMDALDAVFKDVVNLLKQLLDDVKSERLYDHSDVKKELLGG